MDITDLNDQIFAIVKYLDGPKTIVMAFDEGIVVSVTPNDEVPKSIKLLTAFGKQYDVFRVGLACIPWADVTHLLTDEDHESYWQMRSADEALLRAAY